MSETNRDADIAMHMRAFARHAVETQSCVLDLTECAHVHEFCAEAEEAERARVIAEEKAEHERTRKLLHSAGVRVKIGVTLDHKNTLGNSGDETMIMLRPVTTQDSLKQLMKTNPELRVRGHIIGHARNNM